MYFLTNFDRQTETKLHWPRGTVAVMSRGPCDLTQSLQQLKVVVLDVVVHVVPEVHCRQNGSGRV